MIDLFNQVSGYPGAAHTQAFGIARFRHRPAKHQRELGDTAGQIYSIALVSVYLGFWLATFAFS